MIRHPKKLAAVSAACAALLLLPGPARPADEAARPGPDWQAAQEPSGAWQTQDPAAAPTEAPPPAPGATPPPPPESQPQQRTQTQAPPPGQWVYTQQYGWLWMPYSDRYTYVPPDGYGEPYTYVYYPSYGWAWVVSPWVWGWGPWPYFGAFGVVRFGWYGHGWWRTPWRYRYAPVPFGGHGRFPGPVVRPVPYRPGGVAPRTGAVAPAPRANGGGRRGGHRR